MNFSEAKEVFKKNYTDLGLILVDEHKSELYYKIERNSHLLIKVSQEEINQYIEFEHIYPTLSIKPVECSICGLSFREQRIDNPDYNRYPIYRTRDLSYVFGDSDSNDEYAIVGQASDLFINFFRFDNTYFNLSMERILRRPRMQGNDGSIDMCELLYRPLTVSVHNIQGNNLESIINYSTTVIESCLFELSYIKGITLNLMEDWPLRIPRVRPFQFGDSFSGHQLPFPKAIFNTDLVRFYKRGMETSEPVFQFLSYYHVLEYHFVAVSDEQLYVKLSRRINDPKFSTSQRHLDRIINDTLTHKRETDETEMLKLVLKKFIDEYELIEFIKGYEDYLGKDVFSKKQKIFGEDNQVDLIIGHVIGGIARRVKLFRNALVHSSDRFDRNQRYIPTLSNEDLVKNEIPLMKYLAEKVIVGSAK